ncbi:SLC26A6 [Mytilus coruscus]|uniref:SLC26A6 n=1 Tax=Mytilus coruscus TaxID=42192 RepID=A0A6J8A6L3_MYTCO|nr:SLC26A6 [Mytilus coruscus]
MAEPETEILEITANEDTVLHRVVDFNAKYYKQKTDEKICDRIKRYAKKYSSINNMKSCLFSNVPIIRNLRKYNLRKYLVSDILSGITVGIMQIPQGMAFGLLTTLPPICGMYTAFFGPLTYFFFGSSRHLSVGAVAVVSLMMASVIDVAMQENNLYVIKANSTNTSTDETINTRKIEIATSVSFVSGLIMILLGKLKFGLISTYMSEQLVSGFTAAVAIHITTSQAKHIFGISVPQHNGIFKVIKTWRDVCYNIPSTNFATLITTVICFIILYLVKVQINMRFKAKLKMPIPIELIIISIATVIAHFAKFHQRFNINILKDIPAGLPSPVLPNPVLATGYVADAFIIGIVAFTHSVSGARLLARKHNYEIDPNQELVASGAGSVVCSIFSGYINAGSLSRTMVLDGTNGKSQIACLVGCVIVIIMILAIGPLFYSLPKCVLSAVIIINLRTMYLQILEVPSLWRTSKFDFTWRDVCYNIPSTNFATLITTVICFIILYLVKVQINMRFKAKMKMPIPIELIIISIATVITHFAKFHQRFNINILKDIPAGLPSPVVPNPVLATGYVADAFIIGIVAFTHSVSGARLLARKHNYEIDPNQELVASGAGSVVCSIFSGYINAGSLSRTMVLDGTNGKSQIACLVGCVIVIIMIIAIGPLFYSLPKCVLSAVIIINLRTMYLQILEVPSLWRTSKFDFVIWMVTFLTSSILDVDIGIASSLIFSLLTVSLRTQSPSSYRLGFVGKTNQLKSVERYDPVVAPDNVRIVQFQAPIYFANADIFVKSVVKLTGIDPVKARKKQKQFNQVETNISPTDVTENCGLALQESKISEKFVDGVEIVILDFSGVNFIDIVGIKALKRVYTDYNSIGIQVYIASCNDTVTSMMTSTEFMKDYVETVYLTVNCILTHKKLRSGLQV